MNLIEIVLTTLITVSITLVARGKTVKLPVLAILGILIIAQYWLNGFRWPVIPHYLLLVYLIYKIAFPGVKSRKLTVSFLKWTAIAALFLLAWTLPFLFPFFEFQAPTGKYAVGTTWLHLTDSTREEVITANPNDKRELMVKVWYPAKPHSGTQESYLSPIEKAYGTYGLPAMMTAYFYKIKTFSYHDAKIADETFPVLIFSPGFETLSGHYHAFLPEIASHGYIVLNINHTYESTCTEFPDGRVVTKSDSFSHAHQLSPDQVKLAWNLTERFNKATTNPEKIEIVKELCARYAGSEGVRRWTKDHSFVIDELERIDHSPGEFLFSKMDLSRIGAFGHSFGGAAAGQTLITDNRVLAAVNWDGSQFGDVVDTIFQKPFMLLSHSGQLNTGFEVNPSAYHNKSRSWFYDVVIEGTGHSNYSDIPYWINLRFVSHAGEIKKSKATEIINKLTINFFDHYVKRPQGINEKISSSFSEVVMRRYKNGEPDK